MSYQQEMDEVIGENVRRQRVAAGLSQADLAKELEVKHGYSMQYQTIQKIEGGTRPMKFAEAVAIAGVLRVSTQMLSTRLEKRTQEWFEKRLNNLLANRYELTHKVETATVQLHNLHRQLEDTDVKLAHLKAELADLQAAEQNG